MNARRHGSVMVAGALIATLMVSAPGLTVGPGPGGGGGGGQPGDTTGSIYADLVIALRAANGTPELLKYVVPPTVEVPEETEYYCVQPVSYAPVPGLTSEVNPVDGRDVWVLPLQGEWIANPPDVLPVEEIEPCDPWPQYAMFVSEVELERLNLVRTSDQVIEDKLADVERKLMFAEDTALQSTGRITFDGTTIDASPENAAIYKSLMTTGTIPGLPAGMAGPPAWIGPEGDAESNSRFHAWELAAVAIGAAASKGTLLNVDTVEYYNRISGLTASTFDWDQVHFVQSAGSLADSENFVDYTGFTYNRSQTYKGSVTWLDVPTLTWKVSRILDVVPFTNLTPDPIGNRTLTGVVAFAQLADDVRAMSNFIPDNTFIPGFYMDVPGVDTGPAQKAAIAAITDPVVTLGTLPENVFPTESFEVTASLSSRTQIDGARLRITIDAPGALASGHVSATADGQSVPFTVEGGNLVGWWGPMDGFLVEPGYNVSTTFDALVADGAPTGVYSIKLELVTVSEPDTVLADDTGTITVNDKVATVLWGDPMPKFTTQGTWAMLPLRVYAPTAGTLTLTVAGCCDDPATPEVESLAAGDVKVYGSTATDMVAMAGTFNDTTGVFTGTWPAGVGFSDVTWYASVAAGAPVGNYTFGVSLAGSSKTLTTVIYVYAPEVHGLQPPDAGEDTTPPVVTITPTLPLGSTATFALAANEDVMFECQLVQGSGEPGDTWEGCSTSSSPAPSSSKTYTALEPGDYLFAARGTDKVGLISTVETYSWTVAPPPDITPPVVTITPTLPLGATATFTLTADEAVETWECQLTKDSTAGDWATCTSPKEYTGLEAGTYVFSARATDAAGNRSAPASSDPWTVATPPVDTTPPVVTVTPTLPLGSKATFTLTADEPVTSFECRLTRNGTAGAWAACTTPKTYTGLKPGTYVFSARATDAAGNWSAPVSSAPWTVRKG